MLIHPVGILLLALSLVLIHGRNQVGDILECIGILVGAGSAVACRIRSTIVCQLALFEERLQTVFLYHQDGAWCSKVICVVFVCIVESWEGDGCCIERILLMTSHDVFDREGNLGEDTCWWLEVSTVRLTCQLLQVFGIILNLVELQYLFCTIKTVVSDAYSCTVCNAVHCLDGLVAGPVEDKLCIPDFSHVTRTAYILDEEARADVVQELVIGLEVLRMFCVCLHDVRTIVFVSLTIFLVLLIQVNLEVLDIWCIAQVVITAPMLVVFAYPAFLEGIIIRVILLIFCHRLCHLISCHLHWGDGITIAGIVWNQEVAWVCFDRTVVCLLDVIECIYIESRQYAQLGHVVALYIVAGFRVFHLSDEPRVVAAQYGTCYYRLCGNIERWVRNVNVVYLISDATTDFLGGIITCSESKRCYY